MAKSGAILIREWQGTAHWITMLHDGLSFSGKRNRSLSGVTREDHWQPADHDRGSLTTTPAAHVEQPSSKLRKRLAAADLQAQVVRGKFGTDFNSLHAQHEACEAFIKSHGGEGWRLIKIDYGDGGLSGGTMKGPTLQRCRLIQPRTD
jgi:Protein of unknown function (DUF2924)